MWSLRREQQGVEAKQRAMGHVNRFEPHQAIPQSSQANPRAKEAKPIQSKPKRQASKDPKVTTSLQPHRVHFICSRYPTTSQIKIQSTLRTPPSILSHPTPLHVDRREEVDAVRRRNLRDLCVASPEQRAHVAEQLRVLLVRIPAQGLDERPGERAARLAWCFVEPGQMELGQ